MSGRGGAPTSFDDHSGPAGRMLRVIEGFADELAERQVPVHLEDVVRDGKYLKGSRVGQHPERFVEEQLIWPMLRTLGYEFWSQPHGYPKWDKSRPDFSVQNFDCGLECAAIGEVKTPNKFEYAETQMEQYLSRDLGEPTVGFATDGVRWRVYVRPEKESKAAEIAETDFSAAFRLMPARHLERESYDTHMLRQTLTDAETLTQTSIENRAAEIFQG